MNTFKTLFIFLDFIVELVFSFSVHFSEDELAEEYGKLDVEMEDVAKENHIQALRKRVVLARLEKKKEIGKLENEKGKLEADKKTVQSELNKFKWPVTISNEIDTFFEIHGWKVNLTAAEEKMVKQIGDQQRRVRVKLVKICEHILSDLNITDPEIQQLNTEIDSRDNKVLSQIVDQSKRRNVFCNALVWAKAKRNKIHDLINDGTKVTKYNFFMRESWNECLMIFVNVLTAHQGVKESEEELDFIQLQSAGNNTSTIIGVST